MCYTEYRSILNYYDSDLELGLGEEEEDEKGKKTTTTTLKPGKGINKN